MHFTAISHALRHRGLNKLIKDDPTVVQKSAKLWLSGEAAREEFDPRIVMILEINAHVTRITGSGFFDNNIEQCPLCVINNSAGRDVSAEAITAFADYMRAIAKANNLI